VDAFLIFCFVEPPDQRSDDMAAFGMVMVSRLIKVCRHRFDMDILFLRQRVSSHTRSILQQDFGHHRLNGSEALTLRAAMTISLSCTTDPPTAFLASYNFNAIRGLLPWQVT